MTAMRTSSRLLAATLAAGLTVFAFTGCASPAMPDGGTATAPAPTGSAAPAPDPAASPSNGATADPVRATCDDIVDTDTLAQLNEQGWTYEQTQLEIAGTTIPDGISCMWADFTVPSGDLLIFEWGPVTAEQAETITAALVAAGGTVIPDAEGDYVTEDPEQSLVTDENGYGFTYQFGDGWVAGGDTMQTLLLVHHP